MSIHLICYHITFPAVFLPFFSQNNAVFRRLPPCPSPAKKASPVGLVIFVTGIDSLFRLWQNNGSHQCLHWRQQHPTGVLLCYGFDPSVTGTKKSQPCWGW
jgi:hypothetical protein